MADQKQKLHVNDKYFKNTINIWLQANEKNHFYFLSSCTIYLKFFHLLLYLFLNITHYVAPSFALLGGSLEKISTTNLKIVKSPYNSFTIFDSNIIDHVRSNAVLRLRRFNSMNEDIQLPFISSGTRKSTIIGNTVIPSHPEQDSSGHLEKFAYGTPMFWTYIIICVLLVGFAGVASGLTTGLMSLDAIQLLVLVETGNDKDRKRARSVYQLVKKHHLLLVTLLLANSIAMEALPIFLDRLVPSWLAIVLSVTCILFFGEVLPQALCTGPNQLAIASFMAPIVQALLLLFFVLAWPISKALDWALGREDDVYYARSHLKALIGLHQKGRRHRYVPDMATSTDGVSSKLSSGLGADEVVVIQGALDMADKRIRDIMVKLSKVYMLEIDTCLTPDVLQDILRAGHSRIPVYEGSRHNIRGLLLVKSLIMVDPTAGIPVSEVIKNTEIRRLCTPAFASPDYNPYELLNDFQEGRTHIALVTDDFEEYQQAWQENRDVASSARILGIVTLEDVIEELIQEEIFDEFDHTCLPQPKKLFVSKGNSSIALRRSFSSKAFSSGIHPYRSLNSFRCGKNRKKQNKQCDQKQRTSATTSSPYAQRSNAFYSYTSTKSDGQVNTPHWIPASCCPVALNVISSRKFFSLRNDFEFLRNQSRIKSNRNNCGKFFFQLKDNLSTNSFKTPECGLDELEGSSKKFMFARVHTASAPPPSPSSFSACSLFSVSSSIQQDNCNNCCTNENKFNSEIFWNIVDKLFKWSKAPFSSKKNYSLSCDAENMNRICCGIKKEACKCVFRNDRVRKDSVNSETSAPYWLLPSEEEREATVRNSIA